jgi:deoxyribodipyrimidine photolyase-related protein
MGDWCDDCRYDRTRRTGEDACPFTTLYWDFFLRHADRFARNPRVARQVHSARALADGQAVRVRAREVLAGLDDGKV